MAGTTDTDHEPILGGGDEDTMTDDATNRPRVPHERGAEARERGVATRERGAATRVMNLPPPVALTEGDGLGSDAFVDRFHRREILGRGGMGEVTSWRDERIGREVAIKKMLPHTLGDATARARFLREARVQGQLEHPAIVPVYDLREDADGGLSITMKRVRGQTLDTLLAEHSRTDAGRTPSRRLLSAFASVCLAIEFAHARGVVHRDLKPANIMLGDFGEVYVLDWGLAKILGEPNDDDGPRDASALSPSSMTQLNWWGGFPTHPSGVRLDDKPQSRFLLETQSGSVLGTLGYMAPEQLDEGLGPTSAASDVYSLGAILFELLAGFPLLVAPSPLELAQRTLAGVDARAQQRAPTQQVPPELEDLCVRATARLPHARGLTARGLHDAVEGYLEGDRDLSRRRALASAHIDSAAAALASATADTTADGSLEASARATAMRELGAAIALDPGNADAGRGVLRLLAEPPRHVPAAVRGEIEAMDEVQVREGARLSVPLVLTWLSFAPFAFFMDVLDWRPMVAMAVAIVVISATTAMNFRRDRVPMSSQIVNFTLLGVLCFCSGLVAGPLVMVPTLIATFVAALQSHPSPAARRGVVAAGCGLFLSMVALEWAGVLPTSYVFADGTIRIQPVALGFPETATRVLMIASGTGSILAVGLFISRMRDSLAAAQRRVLVLGWHLRQIVPGAGG